MEKSLRVLVLLLLLVVECLAFQKDVRLRGNRPQMHQKAKRKTKKTSDSQDIVIGDGHDNIKFRIHISGAGTSFSTEDASKAQKVDY